MSLYELPSAPMILNLNCDLDPKFFQSLIASHLSVACPRNSVEVPSVNTVADRARVFLTVDNGDRFHLGLYCHLKKPNERTINTLKKLTVQEALFDLLIPNHSFALLWVSDKANLWRPRETRIPAPFTQIYASWDKQLGELILHATPYAIDKWYSPFLELYLIPDHKPLRVVLKDLKFGKSSLRRLEVKTIHSGKLSSARPWRYTVDLRESRESNFSIQVSYIQRSPNLRGNSWDRFVRTSSSYTPIPVAKVPAMDKSLQMASSILRADIWIPIVLIAFSASVVLHQVELGLISAFFRLIFCVLFPVSIVSKTKSKQFLMIVGTWILLLQVIRFGFQGDFVASMQGLPDGRRKSIRKCVSPSGYSTSSNTDGFAFSDSPRQFFLRELPFLLREEVICEDPRGFGPFLETLLADIPMYTLKPVKYSVTLTVLLPLEIELSTGMASHSSDMDPQLMCCSRLARLIVSHSLLEWRRVATRWGISASAAFKVELKKMMRRRLSPSYGERICKSFELKNGIFHLYRCCTISDLHPRKDKILHFEAIVPLMKFLSLIIPMSFLSAASEISIQRLSSFPKLP